MSDFSPERFWSTFFKLFFNFHVGEVQFYTFRHQLTASPRHEIETFGAKFIVSGTPFRYNCNENCSFCHQFGTKMALSGAILQPGTRM